MPRKKSITSSPVGKKIKKYRLAKKMTMDQVANETGCSIEYLKKIEKNKEIPPVGMLLQIARALQIDSGHLFKDKQSPSIDRAEALAKRTADYAYTTLTPGAENKHLKAFLVRVEALQPHKGVGYQHEGEEFIYVLSGKMEVAVGDHVNQLVQGDSLHFNSGVQHHLKNIGKDDAELLVVIYTP